MLDITDEGEPDVATTARGAIASVPALVGDEVLRGGGEEGRVERQQRGALGLEGEQLLAARPVLGVEDDEQPAARVVGWRREKDEEEEKINESRRRGGEEGEEKE